MKKIIIAVVILAIIIGVLFWKFGYLLTPKKPLPIVTLKLWGLWEDDSLIRPAIDAYQKQHANIKIEYNHQNSPNYRTRIQTQITDPKGPDIFMIHDSWLPMFLKNNYLAATPQTVMSMDEFKNTFYPVATKTLTNGGKVYALPLEIDGLALFYNEDLIKQAGIAIPTDWKQFSDAAFALTKKDVKGNIQIAGAALGSPSNVDHWNDIIGLLFFQQPEADLEHPADINQKGADVLRFFTSFITDPTRKSWSESMESSTQAFYEGKLAFYFAPSWRAHDIRTANSQLHFKTAPVPQLPKTDPSKFAAWATFWAFAVSAKSQNQEESWNFLKFLVSAQTEKQLYQEASKVRLFGQPYSRVDLQKEIINDPIAGSFVAQGNIYNSWYLSSRTFDQGINDEISTYYENAINATLRGRDPFSALRVTENGVAQILDKYGATSNNPAQ